MYYKRYIIKKYRIFTEIFLLYNRTSSVSILYGFITDTMLKHC